MGCSSITWHQTSRRWRSHWQFDADFNGGRTLRSDTFKAWSFYCTFSSNCGMQSCRHSNSSVSSEIVQESHLLNANVHSFYVPNSLSNLCNVTFLFLTISMQNDHQHSFLFLACWTLKSQCPLNWIQMLPIFLFCIRGSPRPLAAPFHTGIWVAYIFSWLQSVWDQEIISEQCFCAFRFFHPSISPSYWRDGIGSCERRLVAPRKLRWRANSAPAAVTSRKIELRGTPTGTHLIESPWSATSASRRYIVLPHDAGKGSCVSGEVPDTREGTWKESHAAYNQWDASLV